jgi:hypothetical protein
MAGHAVGRGVSSLSRLGRSRLSLLARSA